MMSTGSSLPCLSRVRRSTAAPIWRLCASTMNSARWLAWLCGEAGWNQHLDRLIDQLAAVVAEQGLDLGVRQNHASRLVDQQQGAR